MSLIEKEFRVAKQNKFNLSIESLVNRPKSEQQAN